MGAPSFLSLLSKDDWIYAGILGGGFLLSIFLRFLAKGQSLYAVLKYSPGFIGFGVAVLLLGWKIIYSIPIALFTSIAIKHGKHGDKFILHFLVLANQTQNTSKLLNLVSITPQFVSRIALLFVVDFTISPCSHQMPLLVFVVVFVYLLLTRHLHEFIDVPELASQSNAVQLIITLRAIGLAFDVGDSRFDRLNPGQSRRKRCLKEDPSYLMMFNYMYHYCGLFTGPYYSFQMFLDSCDSQAAAFHQNYLEKGLVREYTWRLKQLAWSLPVFIITNKHFPLDGLRSDDVYSWSIFYKFLYAAMVFIVFRMRVYAAWSVSECICVTLNIGIYPDSSAPKCVIGPTDVEGFEKGWKDGTASANSIAIQNIEVAEVEASDGFRAGIRGWNKSVQTWLALYVHSRAPKSTRMVLTMFISALWHGTYAGYFMSFLVVPMCTAAEDVLFRLFPKGGNGKRNQTFLRIYWLTLRTRGFDFMATGFLLKNWKDTHRFWSSFYYWLPITMIVLFFLLTAIESMIRPRTRMAKSEATEAKEVKAE